MSKHNNSGHSFTQIAANIFIQAQAFRAGAQGALEAVTPSVDEEPEKPSRVVRKSSKK